MIWHDDDETRVPREFAAYLTLAVLTLLFCLLLVACAEAVGAFDEMVGWLYGV
jgi:small basic protein